VNISKETAALLATMIDCVATGQEITLDAVEDNFDAMFPSDN